MRTYKLGDWVQAISTIVDDGITAAVASEVGHVIAEPEDDDNWPCVRFERSGHATICHPGEIVLIEGWVPGVVPEKVESLKERKIYVS